MANEKSTHRTKKKDATMISRINPEEVRKIEGRIAEIYQKVKDQTADISLFSEIALTEYDWQFIWENAECILNNMPYSMEDKIMTVGSLLLMDIAAAYYDGSYWPYVEQLTGTLSMDDRFMLGFSFTWTVEKLGLKAIYSSRHIDLMLLHALSLDKDADDLFDYLFDYYATTLSYRVPENKDEIMPLSMFMKAFLKGKDCREYIEESFPVPHFLRSCTKRALADHELSAPLIFRMLLAIDEAYQGKGSAGTDLRGWNNKFAVWAGRRFS